MTSPCCIEMHGYSNAQEESFFDDLDFAALPGAMMSPISGRPIRYGNGAQGQHLADLVRENRVDDFLQRLVDRTLDLRSGLGAGFRELVFRAPQPASASFNGFNALAASIAVSSLRWHGTATCPTRAMLIAICQRCARQGSALPPMAHQIATYLRLILRFSQGYGPETPLSSQEMSALPVSAAPEPSPDPQPAPRDEPPPSPPPPPPPSVPEPVPVPVPDSVHEIKVVPEPEPAVEPAAPPPPAAPALETKAEAAEEPAQRKPRVRVSTARFTLCSRCNAYHDSRACAGRPAKKQRL